MRNTLVIAAILLGVLALSGNRSNAVSNTAFRSPVIVSRVGLLGQTQAIPSTTLFTVPQTGLYRLSSYMATTVTDPSGNGWTLQFDYADDAGAETMYPLSVYSNKKPPSAYGLSPVSDNPVATTFMAVAGTPVNYTITATQSSGGTYELFMIVERLM